MPSAADEEEDVFEKILYFCNNIGERSVMETHTRNDLRILSNR